MSEKIYPIGIQNFEKLRKGGFFYVDKTALMYKMVKTGSYYFLSRPRRFGKSLLISTLEAYFQGKKELFEGLAVEKLEKEWKRHPILHLDLNIERYDTPESLNYILEKNLAKWESLYGSNASEPTFSLRFAGIIERACGQTEQSVVLQRRDAEYREVGGGIDGETTARKRPGQEENMESELADEETPKRANREQHVRISD